MKKQIVLPAILILSAFSAGSAQAEPKNGFALDAGLTTHRMTNPVTGNYQSTGVSLGLDYQFAVSDSLSLNPFLMTSGETVSGNAANFAAGTNAGHGMLGLQLRYWIDNAFLGAHLASYSEVLSNTVGNVTTSTSAHGGGLGLAAGWEKPDGGLFVVGQLDSSNLKYSTSTSKMSGFRLSMGYRWK